MNLPNPYSPPHSESPYDGVPDRSQRHPVPHSIGACLQWLFAAEPRTDAWRSILWWEARRIPVNLLVGGYGICCLALFFWAIVSSKVLGPGEDAIEPLAILAAPVVFNMCYTLGWLVEVPARVAYPDLSPRFGPVLMKLGVGFSCFLASAPAVFWVGYRCLQLVRATP